MRIFRFLAVLLSFSFFLTNSLFAAELEPTSLEDNYTEVEVAPTQTIPTPSPTVEPRPEPTVEPIEIEVPTCPENQELICTSGMISQIEGDTSSCVCAMKNQEEEEEETGDLFVVEMLETREHGVAMLEWNGPANFNPINFSCVNELARLGYSNQKTDKDTVRDDQYAARLWYLSTGLFSFETLRLRIKGGRMLTLLNSNGLELLPFTLSEQERNEVYQRALELLEVVWQTPSPREVLTGDKDSTALLALDKNCKAVLVEPGSSKIKGTLTAKHRIAGNPESEYRGVTRENFWDYLEGRM